MTIEVSCLSPLEGSLPEQEVGFEPTLQDVSGDGVLRAANGLPGESGKIPPGAAPSGTRYFVMIQWPQTACMCR
ncbi:MAG TPA: hypothetical protein VGN34_31635 [Ktedonobacteraceae bacterium]